MLRGMISGGWCLIQSYANFYNIKVICGIMAHKLSCFFSSTSSAPSTIIPNWTHIVFISLMVLWSMIWLIICSNSFCASQLTKLCFLANHVSNVLLSWHRNNRSCIKFPFLSFSPDPLKTPWRLGGFGDFPKKTAVFGCLTNTLAPPPIALESCSTAQTDWPV